MRARSPFSSLLAPPLAFWRTLPPVMRGVLMMTLSTVGFSTMHAMIRAQSADMHPFQIAFFRNFFGLVVFIPLLWSQGIGFLRTERLGLHALRGALNVGAMLCFFTALSVAPIARVTALSFSAPLFTAALSVLILGERFRLRRWTAIALGFLGTLIILRPGAVPIDLGTALTLVAATLWGVTMIVIKMLSRTESSFVTTAYMSLFLSVFALGPALTVWRPMTLEDVAWLTLLAVIGTLAQIALGQALKETEPTAVLPFDFLKLVWASIFGFWLFAETPDLFTWIGAAIVFGSGFYIAYRERSLGRSPRD